MSARILVVRLGAMGDVIHALPAVASLKRGFPGSRLAWMVEPRWAALLESNPHVDEVVPLNRRQWKSVMAAWSHLRVAPFDFAVDFQGLVKSALAAKASGTPRIAGYDRVHLRERAAALLYTETHAVTAAHIVDQHLQLAEACGAGKGEVVFPLPRGAAEGTLPEGDFVLACPFAGWTAKEWPLEHYAALARRIAVPLVLNGHPTVAGAFRHVEGVTVHLSSIPGLIDATRRARAVIGVDSGPLHLAAALAKPGVAIFGPTDPARNGPYGGSMTVLRSPDAVTSYKRSHKGDGFMKAITPQMAAVALEKYL